MNSAVYDEARALHVGSPLWEGTSIHFVRAQAELPWLIGPDIEEAELYRSCEVDYRD